MENQDTLFMNVVGLDHYLKDGAKEDLFATLAEIMGDRENTLAPYVNFEWDRQNKYAPVCFVAKYNYQRIGTLEADMVDEALAIVDEHGRFAAAICDWEGKTITVCVEDVDGKLRKMATEDKCADRITTSALDGIARMEYLDRENEFEERTDDLLNFLAYYRKNNMPLDNSLADRLYGWIEVYGALHRRTMCREDHGVIKRMRMLLEPIGDVREDAFYQNDNGSLVEEINDVYNEAFRLHRHTTQNNGALEIMNYQLDHLREIAHRQGGFIDDYKKVYLHKADEAKIRQEYDRIEQWLRTALPYNVYARYSDDRVKLASNLFYLRLTRAELYSVYEHMLVLEHLKSMLQEGNEGQQQQQAQTAGGEPQGEPDKEKKKHAKLRNAEARFNQAQAFYDILKALYANNAFASDITQEWIKSQIESHLLNKVEDEQHQLMRDQVWVKIETTRQDSVSYKDAPLPRLLEVIGLWCVEKHIILGASELSNLISAKIHDPQKKDSIRVQIQNTITKVNTLKDKPHKLPLIIQLFLKWQP